jgi:hypothetical protein
MEVRKIVILLLLLPAYVHAQTLGGNAVYNFLKLSNTSQLIALGGINISQPSTDVGMVLGKLQVRHEIAYYQNSTTYNQPGLNLKLNEYFGFGKFVKILAGNYFNNPGLALSFCLFAAYLFLVPQCILLIGIIGK